MNDPSLVLADEPTGNLDSRTSVEVMRVFQRLNQEAGITILLVTQEPDIAQYAKRVIVVRDGLIRSDQRVMNRRDAAERVRGGAGTGTTLTPDDLEAILRDAPAVSAVSPSVSASVTLVFGNGNCSTRAEGVAPSNLEIRNRSVASGEMFSEADVRTAARVAVIGETVARELFAGGDPLGQTIRVRNLPFRVIGVLAPNGQTQWGQDQDDL